MWPPAQPCSWPWRHSRDGASSSLRMCFCPSSSRGSATSSTGGSSRSLPAPLAHTSQVVGAGPRWPPTIGPPAAAAPPRTSPRYGTRVHLHQSRHAGAPYVRAIASSRVPSLHRTSRARKFSRRAPQLSGEAVSGGRAGGAGRVVIHRSSRIYGHLRPAAAAGAAEHRTELYSSAGTLPAPSASVCLSSGDEST